MHNTGSTTGCGYGGPSALSFSRSSEPCVGGVGGEAASPIEDFRTAPRTREDFAAIVAIAATGSRPASATHKYHGAPPADCHLNAARSCLKTSIAPERFDEIVK